MSLDGLDAQGVLRAAINSAMIGDIVETAGGSGVVEGIHEDRSMTVRHQNGSRRHLQRDCRVREPARVMIPRVETQRRKIMGVLDWSRQAHVKAHVRAGGTLEKQVCCTTLPLSASASSTQVIAGTLQVSGQDQGWGNTGEAGVHVRLKYTHPDESFDEYTVAKIIYDHNRNRAGRHNVTFNVGLGLKATSAIQVEVIVRTPNYPGWSAHASGVKLDLEVEETCLVTDSESAWNDLRMTEIDALKLLWMRCGSSVLQGMEGPEVHNTPLGLDHSRLHLRWVGHLSVDLSHLSNSGLERQGIIGKTAAASLADQKTERGNVANRIVKVLGDHPSISAKQRSNIAKMSQVLLKAEHIANSPSDAGNRRAACDELLAMIFAILGGLKDRADMAEFVASSFADAVGHCWTAWEEAIHIAYHVVCPEASASSNVMSLEVEDWLLGELLALRRDLAYRTLAKAKQIVGESDVHFKNFFFSSIHFGLPVLQRLAARDPSRLNYTTLNLIDMDKMRADLWDMYTPQVIVAHVRSLLDSSAYWRGRVVDWLRAHAFRDVDGETWLYEWCHCDYIIKDEALVFMLAAMRILQGDALVEIRPITAPSRIASQTICTTVHQATAMQQNRVDHQPWGNAQRLCSIM